MRTLIGSSKGWGLTNRRRDVARGPTAKGEFASLRAAAASIANYNFAALVEQRRGVALEDDAAGVKHVEAIFPQSRL